MSKFKYYSSCIGSVENKLLLLVLYNARPIFLWKLANIFNSRKWVTEQLGLFFTPKNMSSEYEPEKIRAKGNNKLCHTDPW